MDFCLIFVPFGHYDEPKIHPDENPSICPRGADVRHPMAWERRLLRLGMSLAASDLEHPEKF
jgi:hypothetical protein